MKNTLAKKVLLMCNTRALQAAREARTIEEAVALLKREMGSHDALQCVKRAPDIDTGIRVLILKTANVKSRAGKSGFTPEQGDLVRGAIEHFDGSYVLGLGVVNNENLANALGHEESSVVVAKGWRNRDELTREPLDWREVEILLRAI